MPYPETCEGAVDAMHDSSVRGGNYAFYAMAHLADAKSHWNLNQDHAAIYDLWLAGLDIRVAAEYNAYNYAPFYPGGPWAWYMRNCIAAPEIDMAMIIIAMLAANPDEVQYFVGLVDAYRQSIWNRPFNQELYAALARGFAIWG